jgi:hypothetical protein
MEIPRLQNSMDRDVRTAIVEKKDLYGQKQAGFE